MKIACVLGQMFEDSEFRIPYDRLKTAGYQVDVIGLKAGEELKGYKGKEKVKAEKSIDQVKAADYDALLIPGGQSPDHLRVDKRMVDFVKQFESAGKMIAAVCHGPQLLASAGVLKGKTSSAYPAVLPEVRAAGGTPAEVPIDGAHADGTLVTAPAWPAHPAWLKKFLDVLGTRIES